MNRLGGKVAIVSGAGGGIGSAICHRLALEGSSIICVDINENTLNETDHSINSNNGKSIALARDVSEEQTAEMAVQLATEKLGGLDILVNNVGGSLGTTSLRESEIQDFQKVMDINTWVAISLTKLFVEEMIDRGWGRIINIASIYGREYGGSAPYMAAKAALIAATKHTAINLAKTGVTANCIAPGSIKHEKGSWEKFVNNNNEATVNNFIDKNLPMGDFGYPEAVGDTVAFLASENSKMILGTCLNVDGGQSNSLF